MADRVYPAAKPNPPPGAAATGTGNGGGAPPASFPAPKTQMYQRPIYRPQAAPAKQRRRQRSCRCSLCCCFCWALLAVILLAFAAAVAGGAFYLLYRPQRPTFTVSAVRLASLNLTSPSPTAAPLLTDAFSLTLTARNPNKKMVYVYGDLAVSVATAANAVPLGAATLPGFTHAAGNTTVVTATVSSDAVAVDPAAAASDIKRSGSFAVVVDADTSAGVRVGGVRTKKIGIQVRCEGIKVTAPAPPPPAPKKVKGKNSTTDALAPAPASASSSAADAATTTVSTVAHSCKVRVRVKIWKWTF